MSEPTDLAMRTPRTISEAGHALMSSGDHAARAATAGTRPQAIADALTHQQWNELVDAIVRRLERRVRSELDRRGRRHMPRVM